MSHSHDHSHDLQYDRAFGWGVGLNVAYVLAEAGFGFSTGSLALLADAGHNLSDVLSLLLAWGAHRLARRAPTERFTYGLRSTTILAALANAVVLLVSVGAIAWEAVHRFNDPAPIAGWTVVVVAAVGVLVNGITTALFFGGRHGDVNVKGAYLHMAADTGVSLAVVLAGLAIAYTHQPWIDPVTSLVIAFVILVGTWDLFRESVGLALHAVPRGIDPAKVRAHLAALPGVTAVHDLHVWATSTTETALTVHLVQPGAIADDAFLHRIAHEMHDAFGISHTTVQIENGDSVCALDQHDRFEHDRLEHE